MLAPIFAQTTVHGDDLVFTLRRLCLPIFATKIALIALVASPCDRPVLTWLGTGFATGMLIIICTVAGGIGRWHFRAG